MIKTYCYLHFLKNYKKNVQYTYMNSQILKINDFMLFLDALKAFSKVSNSAKLTFSQNGMTIFGKNACGRGEVVTNSVYSDEEVNVCFEDLSMLIRLLQTAIQENQNDWSELSLIVDLPTFKIESKKFKTKIQTTLEKKIEGSIIGKVKTELTPVFEFTTSSDQIKNVNSHSFILPDIKMARIYLRTDSTMENNVIYATIGNEANNMNNSVTLKFGLVNDGSLDGRKIIIDYDHLGLFNIIKSDAIKIQLMDRDVLVNKTHITGKNESYFDFTVYCSMLAK